MDNRAAQDDAITPLEIPLDSLNIVLSGWSGKGQLIDAIGKIADKDVDRAWSLDDVRRRADRIVAERIAPDLRRWPKTVEDWLPHLPVTTQTDTNDTKSPRGRVDWRETARRHGWPARAFVSREKRRAVSDVSITTLAWTVEKAREVLNSVRNAPVSDGLLLELDSTLSAAIAALEFAKVPALPPRPDRHDMEALKSSGSPWTLVAPVAETLLRTETDLVWFATHLLAPDDAFRWRLYHLSVLGEVLNTLHRKSARVKWLAPLGMGPASRGPHFAATLPDGTQIDVWFEAAGAHAFYNRGRRSLYSKTVSPVEGADSAIGADIALFIRKSRIALLLECKFSWSSSYIGRDGFHQASGYALNAQPHWDRVWSYVVGPVERVAGSSRVPIVGEDRNDAVGVTTIAGLDDLIEDFLS